MRLGDRRRAFQADNDLLMHFRLSHAGLIVTSDDGHQLAIEAFGNLT